MDEPQPPLDYAAPARDKLSPAVVVLIWSAASAMGLGAFGFVVGFAGPIIFIPDSNQGPLLGFFVTGPLGFLVGGIGGCIIGLIKVARSR